MGFVFFELLVGKHPDDIILLHENTIKSKLKQRGISKESIEIIEKCF